MAFDGETIQVALFERLKAQFGLTLKAATRRDVTFDDVPPEKRPCLVLLKESEQAHRNLGVPTMWTIRVRAVVYVNASAADGLNAQSVETQLHAHMKTIDAALKRQPNEPYQEDNPETTLGGQVFRCYRESGGFFPSLGTGGAAVDAIIEMVAAE